MPRYIVRQPNGKLAEFSTVVDHFTALEMTREEAVQWCIGQGMSVTEAEAKVKRGEDDDALGGRRFCEPPEGRWKESLVTILSVHGTVGLAKFLKERPETFAPEAE